MSIKRDEVPVVRSRYTFVKQEKAFELCLNLIHCYKFTMESDDISNLCPEPAVEKSRESKCMKTKTKRTTTGVFCAINELHQIEALAQRNNSNFLKF